TGFRISTGVEIDLSLFRDQGPIFLHTGFNFALNRVPAAGHHGLRDILYYPDGPLRFSRQGNHQWVNFGSRLTTVGGTDEVHMHSYFGQRIVKSLSDLLPDAERMTSGCPNTDPVALHLGNCRMRLHGIVIDHRKLEAVLEDLIGLGETFFHVAFDKLGL